MLNESEISLGSFIQHSIRQGGQVLARLWRFGRSMFDVHFFQFILMGFLRPYQN